MTKNAKASKKAPNKLTNKATKVKVVDAATESDTMHLSFDSIKPGTNINEIKVDPRLLERANTGLSFVDVVLSGPDAPADERGLVPSEVILFTGDPGAGKSTLALQLADAMTGVGHEVLYIGGEESAAQMRMTYNRLRLKNGFVVANPMFMDTPEKVPAEVVRAVGDNTVAKHLDALLERYRARVKKSSSADSKGGPKKYLHPIVIVDSLASLNDGKWGFDTNSKTPNRCLAALCKWAKTEFGIVIVIGHVGKSGTFKGDNVIKHMIDGHLELAIDDDPESKTCGMRFLQMSKHRFGPTGLTTILNLGKNGFSEQGKQRGV